MYIQKYITKNYSETSITPEFIVIHFSGGSSIECIFDLFDDPQTKVSSHIVIDTDGTIYETLPCLDDKVVEAWHAGRSSYILEGKEWTNFNHFSIGIELVNINGNFFKYPIRQMEALVQVIKDLKDRCRALDNPERIMGHEQIAWFRGKVDPGLYFNWQYVFNSCFSIDIEMHRQYYLPAQLQSAFSSILTFVSRENELFDDFWHSFNFLVEKVTEEYFKANRHLASMSIPSTEGE